MKTVQKEILENNTKVFLGIIAFILVMGIVLYFLGVPIRIK